MSDRLEVRISDFIVEQLASSGDNVYTNVSLRGALSVFVGVGSVGSLLHASFLELALGKRYEVAIEKVVERMLSEPYNACSDVDKGYHGLDCIGECVLKDIGDKYNCSYTRNRDG